MRRIAQVAFFFSGVAGLTFEVVWSRYLGLAMGATTAAVATVTAAYMGGLAIGSHLGGKWADRIPRPLVAYGVIEIAIAVLGALVPVLSQSLGEIDAVFGQASGAMRTSIRFAAGSLLLLVPTTAMGATLPILARAVTRGVERVGREVGSLYALNIAGAVLGAGLAGFWWIGAFGHRSTHTIAVGIDLVLGVVALGLGLRLPKVPTHTPGQPGTILHPVGGRLVALLAVTGATAMALQVLWTRSISTALGPSTYAFTAILCVYLLGLTLGSGLGARFADRPERARARLATALLATGACAFVGIALVDDLPALLHPIALDTSLTPGALLRTQFMLAGISLLPATIAMGTIFPLTLGAIVGSEDKLGAAVGRAYAVNTIGSIAGCFLALFVLLPRFGVEWGMRVCALTYPLAAAALTLRLAPALRTTRWALVGGTVAVAGCMVAWPSWNIGMWTLGVFRLSFAREFFAGGAPEPSPVIFHRDGMHSTVTVEEEGTSRWIKVDGKIDGSSDEDMPTQLLCGLLPGAVRPNIERAVIIGCGTCVTAGAALRTDVKELTLVEIEPAVIEGAKLFAAVNNEPWNDPRLTIVEDDGRNFMRRGARRPDGSFVETYDFITSEPSNPWMTGAASLFTQEFFELAKARLADDGVFLQWLQAYELAPVRINSVLKTFQSVFPHVLVFGAHRDASDLLVVGSKIPLRIDLEHLTQFYEARREVFWAADVHSPEELLALLYIGEAQIAPIEVTLNTDDNAFIEFGAPHDLVTFAEEEPDIPVLEALTGRRFELVQAVTGTSSPEFLTRLGAAYARQELPKEAKAVRAHLAPLHP